jgi:hypothetical protein
MLNRSKTAHTITNRPASFRGRPGGKREDS